MEGGVPRSSTGVSLGEKGTRPHFFSHPRRRLGAGEPEQRQTPDERLTHAA